MDSYDPKKSHLMEEICKKKIISTSLNPELVSKFAEHKMYII